MIKRRLNYSKYIALACLILMLLSVVLSVGAPMSFAFADTSDVTNVLDDLRQADNFDVGYYPPNVNDHSISVIQIAETTAKELFVYVYQPSGSTGNLTATSINIAETDSLDFKNYKLKFLNSSGVFYKYVVQDFTVSNNSVRYYYISSIYRQFMQGIDHEVENDNTISEVVFEVGKQYRFAELSGESYCDVIDIETIEITDKFVGFVRYSEGYFLFGSGACDSHFIAFNTDRPIDSLLEADVYYTTQRYTYVDNNNLLDWFLKDSYTYYSKEDKYAYLTYKDKASNNGNGWGAAKYTWDRIETVEKFLEENDITQNVYSGSVFNVTVANRITEEGKKALEGKQWILRFAETSYTCNTMNTVVSTDYYGTLVGDVSILRLKFETDGEVYNLGVVDNKQTGSNSPINDEKLNIELTEMGKWILLVAIIIVALLLIVVLCVVFPPVLGLVKTIIRGSVAIAKALWWLIKLPFKGLKAIIEKIRNR